MSRFLLTHSLLGSWLYSLRENPYETAEDEDKPKLTSYEEFLMTLRRERTPVNEAMQRGIDFEDLITSLVTATGINPAHKWIEPATEIASTISGGVLQYAARMETEVNGVPLLLYGRLDALKAGVIYDIKFSGSYEVGKFIDSTQHPMYLELVPQASKFVYLISNGSTVWPETYTREETQNIRPTILQFFDWLDLHGLMGLYEEKWAAL